MWTFHSVPFLGVGGVEGKSRVHFCVRERRTGGHPFYIIPLLVGVLITSVKQEHHLHNWQMWSLKTNWIAQRYATVPRRTLRQVKFYTLVDKNGFREFKKILLTHDVWNRATSLFLTTINPARFFFWKIKIQLKS